MAPRHGASLGYGLALAAFAGFLYLALVVCAFGVISLLADIDVIADRSVGPIVGPTMTGIAVLATAVSMVVLAARSVTRVLLSSALAGLVVYLLFLLSGSALVALGGEGVVGGLGFAAEQAGRPFAIAVGVLSAAVHVLYLLMLARRDAGGTRPHWGWEGDERE